MPTDTLEETAFFLDMTISDPRPVVIVGAMRPSTAISADGPYNLLQAVTLATLDDAVGRGALIVLNDRIGSAYYTTKTNSRTLDTFKAYEQGYLGTFVDVSCARSLPFPISTCSGRSTSSSLNSFSPKRIRATRSSGTSPQHR